MTLNPRLPVILLFIICQGLSGQIYSQSDRYIDGKVLNTATGEPVAFATVRLKRNQLGVYANTGGDFKIISNPDFFNDSLIITCIGFKRYSIGFNELKSSSVNEFLLVPSDYGLGEISITAKKTKISSTAVIAKAIKKIHDNYPDEPFSFISYYRDYQKRDGNYINLNEALVQTFDNGFNTKSIENKYKLLYFRKNQDFPRMNISPYYDNTNSPEFVDNKNIPYANLGDQNGNEFFILMVHDALRDFNVRSFSFIYSLSDDFLFNHSFSEPVPVYNNNLLLYKIAFKGRPAITTNDLFAKGAIYIQPKTYSIYKIEYSCSFKVKKAEKEMFNINIEYGNENSVDSLMCLKYISFNNIFNVTNNDEHEWFRMLTCNWAYNSGESSQIRRPVVSVEFNNIIDPLTASADNFEVKLGKKDAEIKKINVKDKKLTLVLRDDLFPENDSVRVYIKNLSDINGNVIGEKKLIELYQFRELFVQGYNESNQQQDTCYLRYLPLEQSCVSKFPERNKYWMNSPEKIKNPVP